MRTLLPLETCPVTLLGAYVGDCRECGRPRARRSTYRVEEALRAYFVCARGDGLCVGCVSRRRDRDQERDHRTKNPARAGRFTRAQVAYYRSLSACTGCGGALIPGPDGGHEHAPDCPRAAIPEEDWSMLPEDNNDLPKPPPNVCPDCRRNPCVCRSVPRLDWPFAGEVCEAVTA